MQLPSWTLDMSAMLLLLQDQLLLLLAGRNVLL